MAFLLTVADYDEIVQSYLESQYRPFATNDIVQNLSSRIAKKAVVLKSLDSLVKQNRIIMKNFNRIQIYCCLDKQVDKNIDMEAYTFEKLSTLRTELIALDKQLNVTTETHGNVMKDVGNSELLFYIQEKEQEIECLQKKLNTLKNSSEMVEPRVVAKYLELEKQLRKDTIKRTKIMKNLVMLVKDVMQTGKIDETLEEIGFEHI